jgi:hypothetical protein
MKTFDYKTESVIRKTEEEFTQYLKEQGKKGWELVTVYGFKYSLEGVRYYTFKREEENYSWPV